MVYTFFGHRDCYGLSEERVYHAIEALIHKGADMFYVGNQGRFDAIVRNVLREVKKEYPQINYAVVLAYMPGEHTEYDDYSDTMLPEGIESVHPRYAISWRNNWMLRQSDYVVTYITHNWGGAYQFSRKAKSLQKTLVNINAF